MHYVKIALAVAAGMFMYDYINGFLIAEWGSAGTAIFLLIAAVVIAVLIGLDHFPYD